MQAGITVQVLSTTGPGADLVDGPDGVSFAREINDALAEAVARHPDRFAGFAHLPMREPEAAAKEFARGVRELGFHGAMVNGMTEDRFLDDPRFEPILAAAEALDFPIYLHPAWRPRPCARLYYGGLPSNSGCHARGRRLGVALGDGDPRAAPRPFRRARPPSAAQAHHRPHGRGPAGDAGARDQVFVPYADHLARPISKTILDQVWITTSGIFSEPPFLAALLTFGIDRIMFSVDYPYAPNERGRDFLRTISLSPSDMAKLAHGNADRLLGLGPKSA